MKKITSFLLVAVLAITMSSCAKWQAQHQINALESLVEKVENHASDFTRSDWEKTSAKYEDICQKMNQCEYTNEQLQEIGRLKARYYVAYAKGQLSGGAGLLNGLLHEASGAADELMKDLDQEKDETLQELNDMFE